MQPYKVHIRTQLYTYYTVHFSAGEKLAPNEVFNSWLIGTIDIRTFLMICPPQTEPMESCVSMCIIKLCVRVTCEYVCVYVCVCVCVCVMCVRKQGPNGAKS